MIALSLMLALAAVVSAMLAQRHRIPWLHAVAVVFGLGATWVVVSMIDSSSSAAAGRYAYYVNGVRISQGLALLTENMALFALLGLFVVMGSVRLGILLGKKVQNVSPAGKPMAMSPVIWALCVIAGGWVLYGAIAGLSAPMRPHRRQEQTVAVIVAVVSALVAAGGIGGIIQFIVAVRRRK